jgi:glucosylceramidase
MSSITPSMTSASVGVFGPQMRTTELSRGTASPEAIRVALDVSKTFQTIEGFGAAMTESAAITIARLPEPQQTNVLRELFDPKVGMGFSYMRVPLGSADFAESTYSYCDSKGPVGDELKHFSIDRDQRAVIPMLQRALAINPDIKLMISPWAPPEWMCARSDKGERILPAKNYALYADYLMRTLDAFAKLSPPIVFDAMTIQNEPFFFTPNYPSLLLSAKEQIELIVKHVGPRLEAYNNAHAGARPRVKLFTHDHNWMLWAGAKEVLDGVGRYADAIAYHGYEGDPNDHTLHVKPSYPNLPVYYTEITGIYWDKTTAADDLIWDARNMLVGPLKQGARACLKWNIVLDGKNGPLNGGVDFLKPFIRVTSPQHIEANQEHFTVGVASTTIKRGAVRVDVQTSQPLDCVGFVNPDGSRVLLTYNPTDKPMLVALESGIQASLAPKSMAALRW